MGFRRGGGGSAAAPSSSELEVGAASRPAREAAAMAVAPPPPPTHLRGATGRRDDEGVGGSAARGGGVAAVVDFRGACRRGDHGSERSLPPLSRAIVGAGRRLPGSRLGVPTASRSPLAAQEWPVAAGRFLLVACGAESQVGLVDRGAEPLARSRGWRLRCVAAKRQGRHPAV